MINYILYIPVILFAGIFLFRLLRYVSTPLLKKTGYYKYYSTMFFTMPLGPKLLDIHLGTSWDFFRLQKKNPKLTLFYLAEGLINLSDAIERGEIHPKTYLKGNVFYLKESTISKFGFKTRRMNAWEFFLFCINVFELSILYSIVHGKISIVPINSVHEIYIYAEDLPAHKPKFMQYYERMNPARISTKRDKNQIESDTKQIKSSDSIQIPSKSA